jgi:single-strand DNA-binding protein
MANLNKVMLIGRLTRDPEVRTFSNGGKVAHFGFAVNNRRKNATTGQWEDEPVFLDIEAFNRGETGRQADLVEQSLRKGQQIFIEGRLKLDQWTAQDGQKRSKIKIVVDNFQFLEPRGEGASGGMRPARDTASASAASGATVRPMNQFSDSADEVDSLESPGPRAEEIPF